MSKEDALDAKQRIRNSLFDQLGSASTMVLQSEPWAASGAIAQ